MKRSRLIVALMLFSLSLASFFSMPVMSGENPWDSDPPSGGNDQDTTTNGDEGNGEIEIFDSNIPGSGSDLDWITNWYFQGSIAFARFWYGFQSPSVEESVSGKSDFNNRSAR